MAELRLAGLQRLGDLAAARRQLNLHVEARLRPIAVFNRDEGRRAEQVIDDDEGDFLHLRLGYAAKPGNTECGDGDGQNEVTTRW